MNTPRISSSLRIKQSSSSIRSLVPEYLSNKIWSPTLTSLYPLTPMPHSVPARTSDASSLKRLSDSFESKQPQEVLAEAIKRFAPKIVVACSFGAEDVVLVDMVHRIDPSIPLFYLDTDFLFPETYATRDRIIQQYGLKPAQVIQVKSLLTPEQQAELPGTAKYEEAKRVQKEAGAKEADSETGAAKPEDVPKIKAIIVENPDAAGPFGAKAIGDPANELAAPAIVNANADADVDVCSVADASASADVAYKSLQFFRQHHQSSNFHRKKKFCRKKKK